MNTKRAYYRAKINTMRTARLSVRTISIALVTTFWGLFIAIPALAIHGVFRNRIESLASDAVVEAENIVPEIRHSLKKQQNQQANGHSQQKPGKQPAGQVTKSPKAEHYDNRTVRPAGRRE